MASLRLVLILVAYAYGLPELDIPKVDLTPMNIEVDFDGAKVKLNFSFDSVCGDYVSNKKITKLCKNQMETMCNNTETLIQMADAWSKFPYSSMLQATKQDFGGFDQCIELELHPQEGDRVLGKHCTFGLAIPLSTNITSSADTILLSYCVPDGCNESDVAELFSFDNNSKTILSRLINQKSCATKETGTTMDAPGIIVASIFSVIFVIVVLSTGYDVAAHMKQRKIKNPLWIAFSVFTNGKKLAQTAKDSGGGDQILVLHGIKVISIMWIIAGHAGAGAESLPVLNAKDGEEFRNHKLYSLYLLSAYLAVDTFFFISGFLLAYQYFKLAANKPVGEQVRLVPKMILHRYLRITPVVLMYYLFSVYLTQYLGKGPLYQGCFNKWRQPCKDNWWAVFLYVQNYFQKDDICYIHLWYLSADWQLFLISPFVLIPMAWQFRRRFKTVLLGLSILNVFFILVPLFTKIQFPEWDPEHLEYETTSKLITYFMGVMFGFYFRCHRHNSYIFSNRMVNVIMWGIVLSMMFACTLVLHEVNMNYIDTIAKPLMDVFLKPIWSLGLIFVIYSCTHGYGGVVNWFLTAGWMQVIGKLTYCMYILHITVLLYYIGTKRTKDYFTDFSLFFTWCGHFIISLIFATFWTLMFESPLITLERILLGGARPKSKRDEKPSEKIVVKHGPPTENGVA